MRQLGLAKPHIDFYYGAWWCAYGPFFVRGDSPAGAYAAFIRSYPL